MFLHLSHSAAARFPATSSAWPLHAGYVFWSRFGSGTVFALPLSWRWLAKIVALAGKSAAPRRAWAMEGVARGSAEADAARVKRRLGIASSRRSEKNLEL